MKLNEVTDMEKIEAGEEVTYSPEEAAELFNWYIEEWRDYGDIPKDTPNVTSDQIPREALDHLEQINDLDAEEETEDGFEEGRSEIIIRAMKIANLPVPEGY